MHNIKDLRKNLRIYKKKLKDRNLDIDVENFNKLDELNRNFKDYTFKLQTKNTYWKEIDVYNYTIVGKYKNRRYNNLITFTPAIECIPYINIMVYAMLQLTD